MTAVEPPGDSRGKHVFVVQLNAVEGREAEFNDWYDNVHLPDALAVPGFRAAQRYRLSSVQRDAARPRIPNQYLTIYEMDGDPAIALKALAMVTPGMHISSAMADGRALHVYEAFGERVVPGEG